MGQRLIEVSESAYQILLAQAARLRLSPERVIEQFVLNDLLFIASEDIDANVTGFPLDSVSALAAVERLTTLFADVHFSHIEAYLDDPMLAMTNAELDLLLQ